MDVYGRKPTGKEGEYFRNNAWWWHPLADYCMEIAPEIAARCKGWHSNDGDGLNGPDSASLADALQEEIRSGRCEANAKTREAEFAALALPNVRCTTCQGTGVRTPSAERGTDDTSASGIKCNVCNGSGSVRLWPDAYPFDIENVQAFVNFLRGSGGFVIE
jgi:hypothetical protein